MLETCIGIETRRVAVSPSEESDLEFYGLREFLNASPPGRGVNQALRPEDHRNAPVTELIEGCSSAIRPPASLSTIAKLTRFPGISQPMVTVGTSALFQIRKNVDIHEQPVGHHDSGRPHCRSSNISR